MDPSAHEHIQEHQTLEYGEDRANTEFRMVYRSPSVVDTI